MSEKKYCSLYSYIKRNDKNDLIDIIDSLCMDGYFKKNYITFLYPHKELISKLHKLVDSDLDKAHDILKGLILNGILSKEDFSKAVNASGFKISDPKDLSSKCTLDKEFKHWHSLNKAVIFHYSGNEPPVATEKATKTMSNGKTGKNESNEVLKDLMMETNYIFNVGKNLTKTDTNTGEIIKPYKAKQFLLCVVALIQYVKHSKEHNDIYKSICYVIDNDPIITWFLLM